MGEEQLDDHDHPFASTGQAAELLGVQPAFLRSLDAADLVRPGRSDGGHRRYTRRQLRAVAAIRELSDDGHTLASAALIVRLREDLATTRGERDDADDRRRGAERERDSVRARLDAAHDALDAHDLPRPTVDDGER